MQQQAQFATEAIGLLTGQQAFLDMLARLYYKPLEQDDLDRIAQLDAESLTTMRADVRKAFADMIAYVKAGGSTLRQDINVDYTAAFYGISAYEGKSANPCESVFRSEEGILNQQEAIAVHRIYKKEVIRKDEKIGVPDDHLSFELQFLSMLCERASAQLEARAFSEAGSTVQTALSFLDEHVLSWFDAMADVAVRILETPFYKAVLKITGAFLEETREDWRALLAQIDGEGECCGASNPGTAVCHE